LVSAREILRWASSNETAVCAFNFSNLETLRAITSAAIEAKVPIILQITESSINYIGIDYVVAIVSAAVKQLDSPVALHLDHGKDVAICKKCIEAGFSSVMIDKSSSGFSENVATTREVIEYARKFGVSVEGELGVLPGFEENIAVHGESAMFTDAVQAARYIDATRVDSLAIAIGSVHGPYKGKNTSPRLDITRLREIKCQVGPAYPLVLHGASSVYPDLVKLCNQYGADIQDAYGLQDADIQSAVKFGITKVNIDTDIRLAFIAGIRQSLTAAPSSLDLRKHLGLAIESMKNLVIRKMGLITKV
jgi:fructose-bisphosphate aldolase class II